MDIALPQEVDGKKLRVKLRGSDEWIDVQWTERSPRNGDDGDYRCLIVADEQGGWFTRADGRRQRLDGTILDTL